MANGFGHGVISRWWGKGGSGKGFRSLDEVKRANEDMGGNWFRPDTMRFWRTRVGEALYGGRYFVTSDRQWDNSRAYTIREALPDGGIRTVGELGDYTSRSGAHGAAERMGREPIPTDHLSDYRAAE